MNPHVHKAVKQMRMERAWGGCVAHGGLSDGSAGSAGHRRAHGGRLIIDECRCGATRQSESNGGRTNYGGWTETGRVCHE